MIILTTNDLIVQKNLGVFEPNRYLSNLSIAFFEEPQYAHRRVFPTVPTDLPTGYFYEFGKADLARDNLQIKPPYGAVQPAILGLDKQAYNCQTHQILLAQDKIMRLPFEREGIFDPVRTRVKTLTEQINIHLELHFAENFFKSGIWAEEWQGAASDNAAQKKFKYFNKDTDPTTFLEARAVDLKRNGRRRPNKLVLGVETYAALRNNKAIVERVKYSGTTVSPAVVNEQCLAQIFGVEEVIVADATYNAAKLGQAENMQYIADPKGALLLYTPDAPSIETPSAGYIFAWTISGNDYIAVTLLEGDAVNHVDYLEGLVSYDMRKTSDALAVYLGNCVE